VFLNKITWPIYEIRKHRKIWEKNNVLYIETEFNIEYVLDNKNLKGNTLGMRRLRLKDIEGITIYNLKKVCFTMYDLLQCKNKYFIDSAGILLNFNKKTRRNLIYKKVIDTDIQDNYVFAFCEDIFKPIKIPFIPYIMPRYLGLLKIDGDYLLYELSETRKKNTWRLL